MLKNKQYRLMLALIFSALVHGVVVFYDAEDTDSFASNETASVVVSIELVAGSAETIEVTDKQKAKSEIKQKKYQDREIVSVVDDSKKQTAEEKTIKPSTSDASVKTGVAEQQEVAESNNVSSDEFLKLVYIEISKHKRYPYQARRQRREGRVKINFTLHPDGHVSEVMVMESSRFNVLDRAAQQAVESISPFAMAANYLNVETEFNVNIDYRLN